MAETDTLPPRTAAAEEFTDTSSWQASIDLAAMRRARRQVSLRAGDGGFTDPTFTPRWQQAAQLDFDWRWAYHFARPGDPAQQADLFLQRIHNAGGWRTAGDVAMLDCEWFSLASVAAAASQMAVVNHRAGDPTYGVVANGDHLQLEGVRLLVPELADDPARSVTWVGLPPEQALTFARAWFTAVRRDNPAVVAMIYGNGWYLQDGNITQQTLPDTGYVIADYRTNYGLPSGWDHPCAWQYSDNGRIEGIPSGVDMNRVLCPTRYAHLTPVPPKPQQGDSVTTLFPNITPTDVGHDTFVRKACFSLATDGWPMPMCQNARDPKWVAGVKVLQAWAGLSVDGVVGEKTWPAIFRLGFYAAKPLPAVQGKTIEQLHTELVVQEKES